MNITKVTKMEQTGLALVIVVVTIAREHEVMVLQELTAKVTTNPNKKYYKLNWIYLYVFEKYVIIKVEQLKN